MGIIPFEQLQEELRWREAASPVEEGLEDHPLICLRVRRNIGGERKAIAAVWAELAVLDKLVNMTLLSLGLQPPALRRTLLLLLFLLFPVLGRILGVVFTLK